MIATILSTPFFAAAQLDSSIPAGCHAITAEERAGLLAMNATIPANGMFCDKDKALLYGGCDSNPYPYLQTKNDTGRVTSVSGLNSDFACRLSKFIKTSEASGSRIRITSGYRSEEHQAELRKKYDAEVAAGKNPAPVAKPGSSKHNFGLAADLTFDGVWPNFKLGAGNTPKCISTLPSCKWAHASYAQFGLFYPMAVEPWHIEPSGTVNGKQQPLPQGGWTSDDTGVSYTNTGAAYSASAWTPSMMQSAALFSPVAAQLAQSGAGTATNPTYPTTPTYPTYPTYQPPNETIQWVVPTTTPFTVPSPYTYNVSTSTNISTTTRPLTDYEQIQLFNNSYEWNPPASAPTSTSAPTQLNTDTIDTNSDTDTGTTNTSNSIYDTERPIATTSVAVNPIHVTETFSQNQTPQIGASTGPTQVSANQSTIVRLMTALRDVLLVFVQILKSRPSYGFEAPWKPAPAAVYR